MRRVAPLLFLLSCYSVGLGVKLNEDLSGVAEFTLTVPLLMAQGPYVEQAAEALKRLGEGAEGVKRLDFSDYVDSSQMARVIYAKYQFKSFNDFFQSDTGKPYVLRAEKQGDTIVLSVSLAQSPLPPLPELPEKPSLQDSARRSLAELQRETLREVRFNFWVHFPNKVLEHNGDSLRGSRVFWSAKLYSEQPETLKLLVKGF